MRSFAKYLIAALAILAVGTSQMMGIARGYVCQCSGVAIIADGPVCESAECHDHEHDEGGHDEEEGSHQHEALKDSLISLSFVPLAIALPVLTETDLLEEFHRGVRLHGELAEQRAAMKPPDDSGCGPPAGVLVAWTVVMLV